MRLILPLILLVYFTIFSTISAFGQETSTSSSSLKDQKSTYALAYPGILPDHPFYKLKVLRSKIIPLLINDPRKKIEYYLLETDKGIAASLSLVEKKNIALAQETALKAEHNYTLLTYEVKKIKWDISKNKQDQLEKAALKHQEVLNKIIQTVPKKNKKTFETVIYFSKKNVQEIKDAFSNE